MHFKVFQRIGRSLSEIFCIDKQFVLHTPFSVESYAKSVHMEQRNFIDFGEYLKN